MTRGHWIREPEFLGKAYWEHGAQFSSIAGSLQSRFKHFQESSKPVHCIFVHCGSWENLFLIIAFLSRAEYYTMALYLSQYFLSPYCLLLFHKWVLTLVHTRTHTTLFPQVPVFSWLDILVPLTFPNGTQNPNSFSSLLVPIGHRQWPLEYWPA